MSTPPAHDDQFDDDQRWSIEFEAEDDSTVLVPDAEYEARIVGAPHIRQIWRSKRLWMVFAIVSGGYAGTRLDYYAEIKTGKRSRFRDDWEIAAGKRAQRHDRMPIYVFKNRLFLIRTRTVRLDQFQRRRPHPYSIVERLIERLA